jgi:hypothetical protein
MQSNDLLGSATSPFHFDLQSQINMLYALTQQQIPPSSPSDLKIKRIKYVIHHFFHIRFHSFSIKKIK